MDEDVAEEPVDCIESRFEDVEAAWSAAVRSWRYVDEATAGLVAWSLG